MLIHSRLSFAAPRSTAGSDLLRRLLISPARHFHYHADVCLYKRRVSSSSTSSPVLNSAPTGNTLRRVLSHHRQSSLLIAQARRSYTSTTTESSSPTPPNSKTTTSPPPNQPPKKRSLGARLLITSSLVLLFWTAGFIMAATPAANVVNGFLNAPTDAETLTLFEPATPTATEINEHIVNHPLAVKLRSTEGMTESRPHMKIPGPMREHNFTGGTLLSSGLLEAPPLQFNDYEAELPTMTQIMYFGTGLCGHPGIVHGGLLATMLDEGLARACFSKLPNKFGVTANLKIDYRVPCPAGKYVALKAQTVKVEGRKAWVKGWIESLDDEGKEGVKFVEAEALYIEPKGASTVGKLYSNGH